VPKDIGNRPTKSSIERFVNAFGDDYLAFWANGTYNIVLNTTLCANPSGAEDLHQNQLAWLEERLKYARKKEAQLIFVFGHHPWFLYQEDEEPDDMKGISPYLAEWVGTGLGGGKTEGSPDWKFNVPKKYREKVMGLFKEYRVSAAFSGHFHQNLVSKSSFGMDMIITSSLSLVLDSTGKPKDFNEPKTRGIRIVEVKDESFSHRFVSLPE
jgi:3',5'-cyclic AMP phosphodiesterase CpdA